MGAGGYDWLEVWRRMYDAERAQAEAATEPGFERYADHWAAQANRFAAAAQRSPQPDGFMRFVLPRLRPGDTLLDVGAGTGRYIPLLAAHVAQVVAVEPSPSMRERLERRVAEERLENTRIIAESWPGAAVPPADVAISAHVLYSVREIGPFLQALAAAASRACYLFLALRHPTAFISDFWERLRGEPRLPLPCALEALNALHQLGIPAHMQLVPITSLYSYSSAGEALDDIRHRLRYVPDPQRDAAIRQAIDELLLPAADGSLVPPGLARHAAVIYWEAHPA
jgi:SAM-dependent methyltransferase